MIETLSKVALKRTSDKYEWETTDDFSVIDEKREIGRWKAIAQAAKIDAIEKMVKIVDKELYKRRQMFRDYDGTPTSKLSECILSDLTITSQRWAELQQDFNKQLEEDR